MNPEEEINNTEIVAVKRKGRGRPRIPEDQRKVYIFKNLDQVITSNIITIRRCQKM